MKFSLKHAIAAAIAAGGLLASTGAFAAPPTVPAQPAPIPGAGLTSFSASGDPVYVSVWNPLTGASITEYLGLTAGQIGVGDLTTNLNFGTLSGFSSQFSGVADTTTLRFSIFSTATTSPTTSVVYTTSRNAASDAQLSATGTNQAAAASAIGGANTAINDWTVFRANAVQVCNRVNPCLGADFNDPKSFALAAFADNFGGNMAAYGSSDVHTSGAVGSSLSFYQLTADYTDPFDPTASAVKYAGLWALSALGELTYSVSGGNPVPLPAAVWLLLSGLGGLGVVGRRRKTQVAA